MTPFLIPVGVLGFLTGAAAATSRKGLSMLPQGRSPLAGVPSLAWQKFVTVMVVAPKRHASSRGRLGYFGMDGRRLCDVGFMRDARKTTVGCETGVWTGDWVAPLTTEKYLDSAGAQYEAFSRSMRRMVPKVLPLVGAPVGRKHATLSGLLAVGHLAGESGVASWVRDPAVRSKFQATTSNFEKANGLF